MKIKFPYKGKKKYIHMSSSMHLHSIALKGSTETSVKMIAAIEDLGNIRGYFEF